MFLRLNPVSICRRPTIAKSVTTTVFVRSTRCAAMSIRKSFTTNRVLRHTLKDARSEDGRPIPKVIVDRKLGEGGYNEAYLVSWVSPS